MNSEQYKRANNNSFYVTIIIILSGLLLTVFSLFQYGATIGRISIIIDAFFCAGICALGNFKYPYEKNKRYYCGCLELSDDYKKDEATIRWLTLGYVSISDTR